MARFSSIFGLPVFLRCAVDIAGSKTHMEIFKGATLEFGG